MADAAKLLAEWPSLARANADTVLASPAWRLRTRWNGEPAVLRRADGALADALALDVALDGDDRTLRLVDSETFPDLHLLWARRRELPPEVLLALVEKECGELFRIIEDVFRRQLSIRALADGDGAADAFPGFVLTCGDTRVTFALGLSPADRSEIGRLANLDVEHPSIRSLVRPAEADYGSVAFAEGDLHALAPGDFILFPEEDPSWRCTAADEGTLRILGAEPTDIAFAQFADDGLPPVPPPGRLRLVSGGRTLATGSVSVVGMRTGMLVEDVVP